MIECLESILSKLIRPKEEKGSFSLFDPTEQFDEESAEDTGIAKALNAAFLAALSGNTSPGGKRARSFLSRIGEAPKWADLAKFYLNGISLIYHELESVCSHDSDFADRLKALYEWTSTEENLNDHEETTERIWSVFFPEATGIRMNRKERVEALRAKRTVKITELNTAPIIDPARQILFTSNVLLSIPPASKPLEELFVSEDVKETLRQAADDPQLYWYDHPVQIGVEPEKNEVIYGLRGLDAALEFERDRGNLSGNAKLTCVLSVSVTHRRLQEIAKRYLEEELARLGGLKNIDLYVFTEGDTQRIIDEVLAPAAAHYLQRDDGKTHLGVLGVDGEYGKHYSFLKAIAAFWKIFIKAEIKATFKIDTDQVFPQKELILETGASAFEHFTTPLWGANGIDSNGEPVELGMIAGALVNQDHIETSLFTPDVVFPQNILSPDEHIFFSALPQALSTEAEMMTRYADIERDGTRTCIQRVHVTGGTNGILVDSLRRHRPFTPSFIGRAEDQAYILSVFLNSGKKLAYVHKDGLIMRHDKDGFAQEAIQSAHIGKLVGDYIRILYFSAYAKALTDDVAKLKDALDPFTGAFISKIPTTVVYLRLALKTASLFSGGKEDQGLEFIRNAAYRITNALGFVQGENSSLKKRYEKERLDWNLYYDILSAVEDALKGDDGFAMELAKNAQNIIDKCSVLFERE